MSEIYSEETNSFQLEEVLRRMIGSKANRNFDYVGVQNIGNRNQSILNLKDNESERFNVATPLTSGITDANNLFLQYLQSQISAMSKMQVQTFLQQQAIAFEQASREGNYAANVERQNHLKANREHLSNTCQTVNDVIDTEQKKEMLRKLENGQIPESVHKFQISTILGSNDPQKLDSLKRESSYFSSCKEMNKSDRPHRENSQEGQHILYNHKLCLWPGCEESFENIKEFMNHLNLDHILDDRSTAQTRVQVQIVAQLERQLDKEKTRLEAMMKHLHPEHDLDHEDRSQNYSPLNEIEDYYSAETSVGVARNEVLNFSPKRSHIKDLKGDFVDDKSQIVSKVEFQEVDEQEIEALKSYNGAAKAPHDNSYNHGEIDLNTMTDRSFYRREDVRPPHTYAALIRRAIIESPNNQLSLNDIYMWLQNNFAYFRRNAATWKNAVRHNLSLHKCFNRVENMKGAVWTVNEFEFKMRRPQKGSATNNWNDSNKNTSPYMMSSPLQHFFASDDVSPTPVVHQNRPFMPTTTTTSMASMNAVSDVKIEPPSYFIKPGQQQHPFRRANQKFDRRSCSMDLLQKSSGNFLISSSKHRHFSQAIPPSHHLINIKREKLDPETTGEASQQEFTPQY